MLGGPSPHYPDCPDWTTYLKLRSEKENIRILELVKMDGEGVVRFD